MAKGSKARGGGDPVLRAQAGCEYAGDAALRNSREVYGDGIEVLPGRIVKRLPLSANAKQAR